MRLNGPTLLVIAGLLGLLVVWSTNQILPASTPYVAQMRLWFAGRATGITAYLLLTGQLAFGLVLSHPVNKSTWLLSKRLFPWHENLWVFVLAFVGAHVVSLVLDPYAGVGVQGVIVPGLSAYRTWPVALGTLALYALIVTGLTARYTKLLPQGFWLKLHRFSLVIFGLTWTHGILSGTDSGPLEAMYVATGTLVVALSAYRYWVSRQRKPSFATSLPQGRPAPVPATARSRGAAATTTEGAGR